MRAAYANLDRLLKSSLIFLNNNLPGERIPRLWENPRISHSYEYVYIHIPKTAGTTVTNVLNGFPQREAASSYQAVSLKYSKHAKAAEVKRLLGRDLWSSYFTFAFVRNPWDLMVSSYKWWLQVSDDWYWLKSDREKIEKLGSFDAYMLSPYGRQMINQFEGSLFDWISEDGRLIVDFIGRFENLHDDMNEICAKIGAPPPEIPHLNKTVRKHYSAYYTDETREIVAKRFQKSIAHFGYEFEQVA